MILRPSHFNKGGEVDFGIHGDWGDKYRVSIRRSDQADEVYEVYERHFRTESDDVVCVGTLGKCVGYCNVRFGYEDVVEDVVGEEV